MPTKTLLLTGFRTLEPAHAIAQEASLAWLAAAHARSEATAARAGGRAFDEDAFRAHLAHRLARFGCGADKIASRGAAIADATHTRWDAMQVYRVGERPDGAGTLARTRAFEAIARGVLDRLYAEEREPPADLVHVTCTGYASPSAAQRLVADRGWGERTRVTHAYHMGCYAAFPALRIAAGLAAADDALRPRAPRRCDVVHTEVCSLHFDPRAHEPEQLVVQSLFADGFAAYRVVDREAWDRRAPALALCAMAEVIAPESEGSMRWVCGDAGMLMVLARDVPARIAERVAGFVDGLFERGGVARAERAHARWAVHPGGPKILEVVRDALGLDEAAIAPSRAVLRAHGNMSSATVPWIWSELAASRDVPEGAPIMSLAFGPGLTMCGALLRKGATP